MKIEMEKLAEKFLIYSAKCYAYYKVVSRTSPGKTEIKGLQFTKRDFAPIANRIGYQAINKLFTTGDVYVYLCLHFVDDHSLEKDQRNMFRMKYLN